jgi:hypothetical protein
MRNAFGLPASVAASLLAASKSPDETPIIVRAKLSRAVGGLLSLAPRSRPPLAKGCTLGDEGGCSISAAGA